MRTKEEEYRGRFNKLVKDYLKGEPPTGKRLAAALKQKAIDGCSKSYWYGLKTAVTWCQEQAGFTESADRVKAVEYPLSKDEEPEKRKFCNKVSKKDYERLLKAADPRKEGEGSVRHTHDEWALYGAIWIARATGMRHDEIHNATIDEQGNIWIAGGKKSTKLGRGADRVIHLSDEFRTSSMIANLRGALAAVQSVSTGTLQSRMDRLTNKVFKNRSKENRPSFKSFRHQLGSELKEMVRLKQIGEKEAAYMLGHQSVDSMNRYGDRRLSGGLGLMVEPGALGIEPNVSNIRTPSADLMNEVEMMPPAQKMEIAENNGNIFAEARNNLTEKKADKSNEKTRSASQNRNLGASDGVDLGM